MKSGEEEVGEEEVGEEVVLESLYLLSENLVKLEKSVRIIVEPLASAQNLSPFGN